MMRVDDFDFAVPKPLIAQFPCDQRDGSRLLLVDRQQRRFEDHFFYELENLLQPGDTLVLNDSVTMCARFWGRKSSGGRVELLVVEKVDDFHAWVMLRSHRPPAAGVNWYLDNGCRVQVLKESALANARLTKPCQGAQMVRFDEVLEELMSDAGVLPLPPYIQREVGAANLAIDVHRYQTIYGRSEGSVATPTAGLHFTDRVFQGLAEVGVKVGFLTLHVGVGTFLPVRCERLEDHQMHAERIHISAQLIELIVNTRASGGRVIAVGTTVARSLETFHEAILAGVLDDIHGQSDLFLYPGKEFRVIDGLITNFHLPKSTLIMLVSAFAGKDFIFDAYAHAIDQGYRFFSYGDSMLIL